MSFYFEFATVIIECLSVHIFFNGWYGTKHCSRKKTALFWAAFFLLQTVISLLDIHPAFRVILCLALVVGISASLYNVAKAPILYSALLYIALGVVSEYLCLVLMNTLGFDVELLMAESNARVIYLVLAKSVQLVVILIASSVLRKNRTALTLKQVLPLLPCLLVSIYICVVFFSVFPEYDESQSLILVIAVLGLFYIDGIIIFYTQSIKKAVYETEEQKRAMQHYEMQVQYYQNIYKDREETRALWHDLKKHITAIEALVDSGDNQNARAEYEQIKQAYDELENAVDVGNSTLNAILYHNIKYAKSENIPVSLDIYVPPELSVSAVDLSVIIGNTFDNAVEECLALIKAKSEVQPLISVSLVQKNSMLFYEITNPCIPIPQKKPGNIHGYGLINVKRSVEKYGGVMVNGVTDGQYRVSVRLSCASTTVAQNMVTAQ